MNAACKDINRYKQQVEIQEDEIKELNEKLDVEQYESQNHKHNHMTMVEKYRGLRNRID